jgi:hypothetical protein
MIEPPLYAQIWEMGECNFIVCKQGLKPRPSGGSVRFASTVKNILNIVPQDVILSL